MKRIFICFSCYILTASCSPGKPDISKMATGLADIECRAIALREKRFALANEIRFTQDTLLKPSLTADTFQLKAKLAKLNSDKENILQSSLVLADSIRHQVDSLMQNHLTDTAWKREFNTILNSTLHKRGCIEKLQGS